MEEPVVVTVAVVVQSVAEGAAAGDAPLLRADGGGDSADRERASEGGASDKGPCQRVRLLGRCCWARAYQRKVKNF
jgi:hypothetical protein